MYRGLLLDILFTRQSDSGDWFYNIFILNDYWKPMSKRIKNVLTKFDMFQFIDEPSQILVAEKSLSLSIIPYGLTILFFKSRRRASSLKNRSYSLPPSHYPPATSEKNDYITITPAEKELHNHPLPKNSFCSQSQIPSIMCLCNIHI